jgi:hypothetical protein
VIVGSAISLAGCAGSVCTGWGPITVSKDDKLTDGTARQILKHDEYGASLHCPAFKPKGRFF